MEEREKGRGGMKKGEREGKKPVRLADGFNERNSRMRVGAMPEFWPESLVKWWHHFLSYRTLGRLNACILLLLLPLLLQGLCSFHLGQKTISGELLTGLLLGLCALSCLLPSVL